MVLVVGLYSDECIGRFESVRKAAGLMNLCVVLATMMWILVFVLCRCCIRLVVPQVVTFLLMLSRTCLWSVRGGRALTMVKLHMRV